MEFKRNSVIALYLAGKSRTAIVRELQHLNMNKMFVYRTINRFNGTGSIAKRNNGGPKRTATSLEMIQKVKAAIEQNPKQSAEKLSVSLQVSASSIRRILKNELNPKPYEMQKMQELMDKQKTVWLERIKALKHLYTSEEQKKNVQTSILQYLGKEKSILEGCSSNTNEQTKYFFNPVPIEDFNIQRIIEDETEILDKVDHQNCPDFNCREELYRMKMEILDVILKCKKKLLDISHVQLLTMQNEYEISIIKLYKARQNYQKLTLLTNYHGI